MLTDQLREAIKTADRTPSDIAKDAKISKGMIYRFVSGERDLRLAAASKIAATLGLELVAKPRRSKK